MNIRVENGLLLGTASLLYAGKELTIDNALIDTGSTTTVFSINEVMDIGIQPEPHDPVRELRGIGGTEFVFVKQIDRLTFGRFQLSDFQIEIGAMEYGLQIDGIIGLDFLLQAKARIDLELLKVY